VDHGLRAEAAAECAWVASCCKSLGVAHETLHWDGPKPKTGIQAKARAARYDLMAGWCTAHDVPVLLTAHTADDQAETVVMRQQRTNSAKSLAGIWPERHLGEVRLVRPVLGVTRAQLRDYLSSLGQTWIDDPSNVDTRFERVRIREALGGDVAAAGAAAPAQAQVRRLKGEAEHWLAQHVVVHATGLMQFARHDFCDAEATVQDEILCLLLAGCGLGKVAELQKRVDLSRWLASDAGLRRTLGGVVFAKRGATVLVGREPGRIAVSPSIVPASGELVWDGRFLIRAASGLSVQKAGDFPQIPRRRDVPAFIDAGLPVIVDKNTVFAAPLHGVGAGVECVFVGLKHDFIGVRHM
jgi:tRNA(Ile)-lysidine synthase